MDQRGMKLDAPRPPMAVEAEASPPTAEQELVVMFAGAGLFPFRVAGDKNFQLDLAAELGARGVRTITLSIVQAHAAILAQVQGIHVVPLPFHGRNSHSSYCLDHEGMVIAYHHFHGELRQTLELAIALISHMRGIRRLIRHEKVGVVHWVDSSLVVPVLRLVVGRNVAVVAGSLKWVPKGWLADRMRALALSSASLMVTSTKAAADSIRRLGSADTPVHIAPWGSKGVTPSHIEEEPDPERPVRLLWAGFIQQIGRADFEQTVALAARVITRRSNIEFHFCFKPECFCSEYLGRASHGIHVFVGGADFLNRLSQYDALLSPIFDSDSSAAPPLTWIEALSAGLPIVTTDNPGMRELLTDGESAIIRMNAEELEEWLVNVCDLSSLQTMRPRARDLFDERYQIGVVADSYEAIYVDAARQTR